jgi:hypothetical protein
MAGDSQEADRQATPPPADESAAPAVVAADSVEAADAEADPPDQPADASVPAAAPATPAGGDPVPRARPCAG